MHLKHLKRLKNLLNNTPDREFIEEMKRQIVSELYDLHHTPELARNILFRTEPGVTATRHCNEEVIITMCTFGDRIHRSALTIESLLEQTVKPNRILLNLGRQFEGKGKVPGSIKMLERRGLEIRFTRDIGPYTKLLPTLKEYPNAIIIAVDDDKIYHYDLISNLLMEHLANPNDVVASRCREMEIKGKKLIRSYSKWKYAPNEVEASIRLLPESADGVLYPPGSLDERVFDEKMFMDLCPSAEDFWFKAMSMLKGSIVRKAYNPMDDWRAEHRPSLATEPDASRSAGLDRQLMAVLNYFDLFSVIDQTHKSWLNF